MEPERLNPEDPHYLKVEVGIVDTEEVAVHCGEHDEVETHADEVDDDAHHLQQCKLQRFMRITQIGKGDSSEGVDGDTCTHDHDELRMVGIADGPCDGVEEDPEKEHEDKRCRSHHAQGGGIHFLRVLARSVHEAEECRLHAVGEDDNEQGDVGIDIRDDAIPPAGGIELRCLDRDKEIADETRRNGASVRRLRFP